MLKCNYAEPQKHLNNIQPLHNYLSYGKNLCKLKPAIQTTVSYVNIDLCGSFNTYTQIVHAAMQEWVTAYIFDSVDLNSYQINMKSNIEIISNIYCFDSEYYRNIEYYCGQFAFQQLVQTSPFLQGREKLSGPNSATCIAFIPDTQQCTLMYC